MTKQEITKVIKSISNRSTKIQGEIQQVSIAICEHVAVHHEVSLINHLIESLPKGIRKNALCSFFEAYAKAEYDTESKLFIPVRDEEYQLPEQYESWYELKPEPEYKPFDLNAKIQALIKQARQAAKRENDQDAIDPATLTALSTLVEV